MDGFITWGGVLKGAAFFESALRRDLPARCLNDVFDYRKAQSRGIIPQKKVKV